MAVVTLSPLVKSIRGSVKDLTFKDYSGRAVVTARAQTPWVYPAGANSIPNMFKSCQRKWRLVSDWARQFYEDNPHDYIPARDNFLAVGLSGSGGLQRNPKFPTDNDAVPQLRNITFYSGPGVGEWYATWTPQFNDTRFKIALLFTHRNLWFDEGAFNTNGPTDGTASMTGINPGMGGSAHLYMYDTYSNKFRLQAITNLVVP